MTTMDIKQRAIANLKAQVRSRSSEAPDRPKASVLIPLWVKDGELQVLLTLRSMQLRTNAGEVCFPGGKSDPEDEDEVHTALREAEEEIGLPPDQVEVICRLLEPIVSKGGLLVTAVVGFIEDSFVPSPNPAEVSEVFAVPLKLFIQEKDHSVRGAAGIHSFQYVDPDSGRQYSIWGLTAGFGILVAILALGKCPEFDIDFKSGSFADRLNANISKL